jgi:hypothetical protein
MYLIFILFTVTIAEPCLLFQNTYLSWKFRNETTQTWTIGKHAQYEWIAFGVKDEFSNMNLYLYNNSKLDEYYQHNNSLEFVRPIHFEYIDGDEFWEKHIQAELQITSAQQIFVAYEFKGNIYSLPNNVNLFPHLQFKDVQLEHSEYECVIAFAVFSGRNNIPLLSIGIVYTVLVAILCFVFHNKQPLKSRGWVTVILFLIFLDSAYDFVCSICATSKVVD